MWLGAKTPAPTLLVADFFGDMIPMTTISLPSTHVPGTVAASHLQREYETHRTLFDAQPGLVQRFFDAQAQVLAGAIIQKLAAVRFMLPDQVVVEVAPQPRLEALPTELREQRIGNLQIRLSRADLADCVRQRLTELEQSPEAAVSVSSRLLRFAAARFLVSSMLPAGRSVAYVAAEGEEIPSLPDPSQPAIASALTAASDAIAEEGPADAGRGELHVPYVPYARRFYLPQWVAFDSDGQLLVKSVAEAEAHLASMQRFVRVLHAAVGLAAYFVADEAYQHKRYGILGQLVNQGRALANYQTRQIIQTIQRRALAQELNRGLSVSLPYFDDQALKLKTYPFVIIPAGRIMFVPAFVVRAACEESVRVAQDTRISPSTRKHLLSELAVLAETFETANKN
jgi:hypothetical protein